MSVLQGYVDLSKCVVNLISRLYSSGLLCKGRAPPAARVISCISAHGELK